VEAGTRAVLRVGHKGADAIAPGNTLESFRAAVEIGVDMIEFDVLRPRSDFVAAEDWRRAQAGPAPDSTDPLLVAHDWGDAARRDPITLAEGLDAFTRPPLDRVQIDCDLKVAGREDELVAALREHGLTERAAVSTMEIGSIREIRRIAPGLRVGWTIPRVTRAWDRKRWARPGLIAAMAYARRRLPPAVLRRAPELGVWAVWVYHPLITARLAQACRTIGIQLIAWTVDDAVRIATLVDMGVDGVCTNDPRLLTRHDPVPAGRARSAP
jgi:glycerophosphoryl diester phosphodiesterase